MIAELEKNSDAVEYAKLVKSKLSTMSQKELYKEKEEFEKWITRHRYTILSPAIQYIETHLLPEIDRHIIQSVNEEE